MRPYIIYPHSLLLENSSNSSHVNREHERSTASLLSCFPIHFLTLKPCGRSPFQVQESFSCNLPMVFLSKVLPPKLFPFNINYPLSRLTAHKRVQRLCWIFFFFSSFSLNTTCASLCIHRVVPHHLEDITACTAGTKANRYKMGAYCLLMCRNACHMMRLVVLEV